MRAIDVDVEAVRAEVEARTGQGSHPPARGQIPATSSARSSTLFTACSTGGEPLREAHLLVAVAEAPSCCAAAVLASHGITAGRLRLAITPRDSRDGGGGPRGQT